MFFLSQEMISYRKILLESTFYGTKRNPALQSTFLWNKKTECPPVLADRKTFRCMKHKFLTLYSAMVSPTLV